MQLMADEPSNADIMGAIGHLRGQFEGVLRELDNASMSRRVLHEQFEGHVKVLSNVQFEAEKTNNLLSQTRDEVKALYTEQKKMGDEITPILDMKGPLLAGADAWNDATKWSRRLVYVLGIAGVSIVGGFIWFGSIIAEGIRQWLGIVPPGS
jgi:hypothetical protein